MPVHHFSIATLLLFLATTSSAEDDASPFDLCRDISLIARGAMTARQSNIPLSQALSNATKRVKEFGDNYSAEMTVHDAEELAASLVMAAYERFIWSDDKLKKEVITGFENEIFKECYEELKFDSENSTQFIDDARRDNDRQWQAIEREQQAELEDAIRISESPEMAAYQSAIAQKIRRHWSVPASADADTVCVVRVRQSYGGDIISVNTVSCNGDEAVRRSVEAAVYRASPLPAPSDPDLFRSDLELNLRAEH